jgi:hypothetical protein
MTDASLAAGRFVEGDFRVGHVLSRTWSVFSRNFLRFTIVTAVANLPNVLLQQTSSAANPVPNPGLAVLSFLLMIALYLLSQAILLYAAFQVMNGKPARLAESVRVGLRRFFPVLGLAITAIVLVVAYLVGAIAALAALGNSRLPPGLVVLAGFASLFPAVTLYLTWFVAAQACVVERLGPFRSLGRSRALTKGHRLKIFALTLLILLPTAVIGGLIVAASIALGTGAALGLSVGLASTLGRIISLAWNAIWIAFYSVLGVVTYHDLRVAKEGVGTEQIAAVFE